MFQVRFRDLPTQKAATFLLGDHSQKVGVIDSVFSAQHSAAADEPPLVPLNDGRGADPRSVSLAVFTLGATPSGMACLHARTDIEINSGADFSASPTGNRRSLVRGVGAIGSGNAHSHETTRYIGGQI